MIAHKIEPVYGPVVEQTQNWLAASEGGKTLLLCIAHHVAMHEGNAITEISSHPMAMIKGEIPVAAKSNLALAEKYRHALEVLELFIKDKDQFITTNLPISHA